MQTAPSSFLPPAPPHGGLYSSRSIHDLPSVWQTCWCDTGKAEAWPSVCCCHRFCRLAPGMERFASPGEKVAETRGPGSSFMGVKGQTNGIHSPMWITWTTAKVMGSQSWQMRPVGSHSPDSWWWQRWQSSCRASFSGRHSQKPSLPLLRQPFR